MESSSPNQVRQINDQNDDRIQSLRTLLRNLWLSCYHHQQQLVIGRICAVYALPRSYPLWSWVIPTLLAAFQMQFYSETHNHDPSLWADFSNSARPHIDEIDTAVDAALTVAVWYWPQ